MKQIKFRISEKLKNELRLEAEKNVVTLNELITEILLNYINGLSREKVEMHKKVDQVLVSQIDLLEVLTNE